MWEFSKSNRHLKDVKWSEVTISVLSSKGSKMLLHFQSNELWWWFKSLILNQRNFNHELVGLENLMSSRTIFDLNSTVWKDKLGLESSSAWEPYLKSEITLVMNQGLELDLELQSLWSFLLNAYWMIFSL